MRWPFVSRELYDAMQSFANRCANERNEADALSQAAHNERALLLGEMQRARQQYIDLLEKYHALKVTGATAPEPVRTALVRQDNPVMDAISLASGSDMERRGYLGSWATEQRLRGVGEEDIVHQLLNWKGVGDDDDELVS